MAFGATYLDRDEEFGPNATKKRCSTKDWIVHDYKRFVGLKESSIAINEVEIEQQSLALVFV